jgi:hypothetical protein
VPFDYSKPVAGDVFKLALVKVIANTSVPYKGSYFLMDGLQSNVDFTTTVDQVTGLIVGVQYQHSSLQGYDIISLDTRGLAILLQSFKAFQMMQPKMLTLWLSGMGPNLELSTEHTLRPLLTFRIISRKSRPIRRASVQAVRDIMGAIFRESASSPEANKSNELSFIGTADNARDLNQIIKLIGGTGLKTMYFYGYSTVLGVTLCINVS